MYELYYSPELTKRQKVVFEVLIAQYIDSAQPVGSVQLAENVPLGLSPATIRNVMSELEDLGLLTSPHPSSGRIPTNLGYAYYVESLMSSVELSRPEKRAITTALKEVGEVGVREILERTSVVLSRVSAMISVVIPPRLIESILLKIDLVRVASNRLLVILTIRSGMVRSLLLGIDESIRDEEISTVAELVNERLSGLKFSELKRSIRRRLAGVPGVNESIIERLVRASDKLFPADNPGIVYIGEARHLIQQPEFEDTNRVRDIFRIIEDRDVLVSLLQRGYRRLGKGVRIGIGEELEAHELSECSVIAAFYSNGDSRGSLGLIGPTRMNYARMASLVDFTAKALQHTMAV